MSKREAVMFAAQGVVDIDAPRAKRHKPAHPPGHSSSSNQPSSPGKDGQRDATVGREVKQEQIETAEGAAEVVAEDPEEVREKGLKVWQAVKDAVNKEGRSLSFDFMRLPSKRQYSDYYQLIKHPIALDDIKINIDNGYYLTFVDCVNDLETCFKNAKRYNVRDSQIWKDAKVLHKLVTTEAGRLSGKAPVDGEGGDGSSDVEGEEKKKKQNMGRLLKTRLQKLVDKTDSDGRALSIEFMELPSRKHWPVYYKTIKHPQCLENIFKKLKRKEYPNALEFANDVELVFSNALEFNQEHTPIWEDAVVLRASPFQTSTDHFRHLMADLPPPFAIPAYASSDHSTKIKLRRPNPTQVQSSQEVIHQPNPVGGTLMLRVPTQASPASSTPQLPNSNSITINAGMGKGASRGKITPLVPEMVQATPTPPSASTPLPSHAPPVLAPAQQQSITFAQPSYGSAYASAHYPNALYQQSQQPPRQASQPARTPTTVLSALPGTSTLHPSAAAIQRQPPGTPVQTQVLNLAPTMSPAISTQPLAPRPPMTATTTTAMLAPTPATTTATALMGTATVPSKSTTPETENLQRKLRYVSLTTKPNGRRLDLDARDGVRTWAVRLGADEWSVRVSGVKFFLREGEEEKDEEEEKMEVDGEARKEEEEEDEAATPKIVPAPEPEPEPEPEPAKQSPPKRGRGRPRKKPLETVPESKVSVPSGPAELQVKLNGGLVRSVTGKKSEWEIPLPVGCNVLEIGEKGGMVWRAYLERMGGIAGARLAH
ncbi:hypothetical protein EIP91_012146 [Steccherinum ochraceum]|uniref:Bromo domain-containing protein n=1 Tax=Steccherinum ochraceum TaxID=92696 RepID=A0A4R0RTD9_9APHY|nr:hypothetical protein EIP91_012146 [Steccherinum ochraceum]